MKKMFTGKAFAVCVCALFLGGCCPCRKVLVVDRPIYIPSPAYSAQPQRWIPKTHRDSLLWKASRKAVQSANESTKQMTKL